MRKTSPRLRFLDLGQLLQLRQATRVSIVHITPTLVAVPSGILIQTLMSLAGGTLGRYSALSVIILTYLIVLVSASGHFLTLMSGLDVNGMPEEHNSYVPHDDSDVQAIVKANQNEASMEFLAYSSHPSPTSTISPEHGGSPHVQNNSSSSLPISRSSELAFALHSPDEQVFYFSLSVSPPRNNPFPVQRVDEPHKQATYTGHPVTPPSVQHQYYGVHDANSQQSVTPTSLEYVDSRHYSQGTIASHEQLYDASASQIHDSYSVESHNVNNHFEYHAPISNVYSAYGDAVDPSMVSPLENGVQHAESFITYA